MTEVKFDLGKAFGGVMDDDQFNTPLNINEDFKDAGDIDDDLDSLFESFDDELDLGEDISSVETRNIKTNEDEFEDILENDQSVVSDLDLEFYDNTEEIAIYEAMTNPGMSEEDFEEVLKEAYRSIEEDIELSKINLNETKTITVEGTELIEELCIESGLLEDLELINSGRLTEASLNRVQLSYEAKLKRVESQSAMILAKEANDILYTRYAKFNKLRLKLKEDIKSKYKAGAAIRAREVMGRSKKK